MSRPAVTVLKAFLSAAVFVAAAVPCAEREWQPASIVGRDGSSFHVLIHATTPPRLAQPDGQTVSLSWSQVATVQLGERWPLELQKQAAQDMADLKSDDFSTRQKALQRLRQLGSAAAPELRKGQRSDDPEVATRSRELLAELGVGEDTPDTSQDRVQLKDGRNLAGRLLLETVNLHSRWGALSFPLSALASFRCEEESPLSKPQADMEPVPVQTMAATPTGTAKAFNIGDLLEDPAQPPSIGALNSASFDDLQTDAAPLKDGTVVEDLYASKGLLLRTSDPKQRVIVDNSVPVPGRSGGLAACVDAPLGMGDLELHFIQPSSFDQAHRTGRPAGVLLFGVVTNASTDGYLGLEAYDRLGRLLVRCQNQNLQAGAAGSFMGIRASVPIVRIRVFRMPGYEHQPLRIDDILYDACVPADREPTQALLELQSGEQLVGRPEIAALQGALAFRPTFLPQASPPVTVDMKEIKRYEPPVQADDMSAPPHLPGPLHAVRLQNGEAFRARFMKLDAKQIALELPGSVQLTLPRGLVRKIDLYPQMAEAGSEPAALSKDEKPGVEFRPKRVAPGTPAGAKQDSDLPRMDNAEVISADINTGELTVDPKDGAGEWRIDLFSTRFLVFPSYAESVDTGKKREWVLRLRQGGCFSVALTGIAADHLDAEMAGAKVTFPARVVATVERE